MGCTQHARLPLLVLPPRSPQPDGIVERTNRTMRVECWSEYRGERTCAGDRDQKTSSGHRGRHIAGRFSAP